MKICLITQSHLSFNPRLVKEADALVEAGYDVSVITPRYSKWAIEADKVFATRKWRVVASPAFGPLAPKATRVLEILRRLLSRVAVRKFGARNLSIIHAAWHPITPALIGTAKRVKADLYIAHYPAALPAAARAAALHRSRYAFDAEDFHLGDPPEEPRYDLQRTLLKIIENRYLPGCAFVTAASPLIAAAYSEAYGIKLPTTLLNVFPKARAVPAPSVRGSAQPGQSVYWVSRTIGPGRGIEAAVKALTLSRSRPHLYLRGTPAPGFIERLQETAGTMRDHLHILPMGPPEEMETLASFYDLGLVAETGDTPNHRMALANKQFTYMLAGIPSLLSDIPSHRELALDLGPAAQLYTVDDAHSLAEAIDFYLLNPPFLQAARAHAFELGQKRFNWDIEKNALLKLTSETLARKD